MRKGVRGGVTHKVAIAIDVVAGNAGCRVPVEGHVAAVEGVGQVGGNGVVRRRINVYNDRLVVVVNAVVAVAARNQIVEFLVLFSLIFFMV